MIHFSASPLSTVVKMMIFLQWEGGFFSARGCLCLEAAGLMAAAGQLVEGCERWLWSSWRAQD